MRKAIFVAGSDHSGSTLLGCVLGSNSKNVFDNFHVGEAHAFFKGKNKGRYGGAVRRSEKGKIWASVNPELGYSTLLAQLKDVVKYSTVIDSSKTAGNLRVFHEQALRERHDFVCLISYRPFGKIWQSEMHRQIPPRRALNKLLWYREVLSYVDEMSIAHAVINTEDFIDSPSLYAKTICDFAGIEYFPGKEEYWLHEHCHLFGGGTQNRHIENPGTGQFIVGKKRQKVQLPDTGYNDVLNDLEAVLLSRAVNVKD